MAAVWEELLVIRLTCYGVLNMKMWPVFVGCLIPCIQALAAEVTPTPASTGLSSTTNVRITVSPATDFSLGMKKGALSYSVPILQPGALSTPNANFALDLAPFGPAKPVDNGNNGNLWIDPCNADFNDYVVPFTCSHVGVFNNGDVVYGASHYNGDPIGSVYLPNNVYGSAGSSTNKVDLQDQTYIDPKSQFFTRGMLVQGTGSVVGSAGNIEDAATNLVVSSVSLSPSYWSYSSTSYTATPAVETPNGKADGALVTSTARGGNISQSTGSTNGNDDYTISVYVWGGSTSSIVGLNASLNTGGTAINTGVTINPATGALAQVGSVPVAYGAQKIIVGCQTGCTAVPTVWWRLWLTVANQRDTNITQIVYPSGFSGAPSSAVLWGAQVEHSATLSSYIPTPGSVGVTRPVGTSIAPVNASSLSVIGPQAVTTSSIGGSALVAGTCASSTVLVAGLTTAMDVHASPITYPGDGFWWDAYASSVGTATVKVCASVSGTPLASAYNVRVIQ